LTHSVYSVNVNVSVNVSSRFIRIITSLTCALYASKTRKEVFRT